MNTTDGTGNGIRLDHTSPAPPPLSLPNEIFRFHDNYCRSISLYISLFLSLSVFALLLQTVHLLLSFSLPCAPKITTITVRPSRTTNTLCPLMLYPLCSNSVEVPPFSLWHAISFFLFFLLRAKCESDLSHAAMKWILQFANFCDNTYDNY